MIEYAPEAKRQFKSAVYEQFARCTRALASPQRLELLDLLAQASRTVEALARAADLTVANTSRHLQILRAAYLVESQRSGPFVTYRLADAQVGEVLHMLRVMAESRLAEIDRIKREFLGDPAGVERVDRQSLLQRVQEGSVVVLDVRPVEEYQAGHLPGALSVPLKELEERLSEIPADQEIVAYCRGPYCILALEAVALLRARGRQACRLEDGVWDWRAMGYPVERS